GFMGLSTIDSIPTFYGFFVLGALGASIGGIQTINLPIVNWFERKRATALGLVSAGFSLGGLMVPAIAYSMTVNGWRQTLLYAGAIIIAVALPMSFVIRDRPEPYGYFPDGADAPPRRTDSEGKEIPLDDGDFTPKEAIRTPAFWFTALGHASAL